MKILQLNFERGWRGGERQTLYCMRQFREAGHEVALMARRGSQMADTARSEGFQVYEQEGSAGQINFLLGSGRKFDLIHAQQDSKRDVWGKRVAVSVDLGGGR